MFSAGGRCDLTVIAMTRNVWKVFWEYLSVPNQERICVKIERQSVLYTMHQVWQCEESLDVWQRDLANKCRTWKRECSMLDEHDQMDVWFTLKERKKNAEMSSEPVSLVIKKGWLKWFGYVEQQWKWKEVNQGDI